MTRLLPLKAYPVTLKYKLLYSEVWGALDPLEARETPKKYKTQPWFYCECIYEHASITLLMPSNTNLNRMIIQYSPFREGPSILKDAFKLSQCCHVKSTAEAAVAEYLQYKTELNCNNNTRPHAGGVKECNKNDHVWRSFQGKQLCHFNSCPPPQ